MERWHGAGTVWIRRAQSVLLAAVFAVALAAPLLHVDGGADGPWVLHLDTLVDGVAEPLAATLSAVLCLVASRRTRDPRNVRAWRLLAAACLAIAIGEWLDSLTGMTARLLPPLAPGDPLLLLSYPLLVAGVWLLLRSQRPRWSPTMWWDGVVVAVSSIALGAAVLDLMLSQAEPGAPGAGGAGFVVADITALATVLGLIGVNRALVPPALWWIAGALGLLTVADARLLTADSFDPLTGAGAIAAYVLLGLAAPDGRADADGATRRTTGHRQDRLRAAALPGAAVIGCLVVVTGALLDTALTRGPAVAALLGLTLALVRLATTQWVGGGGEVAPPRHTDDVTGLANRRALSDALTSEVVGPEPGGTTRATGPAAERALALLLVDLDRFKDINDALGHGAGDRLLAAVGDRFSLALHDGQLLARLGGDEFAVLVPDVGPEGVQRVARALQASLEPPIQLDGERLHVRASIGAAIARIPRDDPTDLLRRADVAMYQAKADGGSGLRFYAPEADTSGQNRLRRIDEFRTALTRGDIVVHVQPQVSLRRGDIVGVEALARWRHKDGVLLPEAFLPLAAQTGLIRPVARSIIDAALGACARWWHAGHQLPVAVNLTADDLSPLDPGEEEDIWVRIEAALKANELPGAALHIEITEETLLHDPQRTAVLLQRARATGIKVALDDYGTGYSALAYLRQLPVDVLKLDQVFARNIAQRTTTTIVRHTVAMAHSLGLRVVAEGIEDEATARALTDLGCDVGQGLFFSDALHPEAFLDLLGTRAPQT